MLSEETIETWEEGWQRLLGSWSARLQSNGGTGVVLLKPWLGYGGADRWAVDTVLALRRVGQEASIWTNRHVREASFSETLNGEVPVQVRTTLRKKATFDRFRVWRTLSRQCALARAMKREGLRPAVIICDVVPHVVPYLKRLWPDATILIYCHYPDRLMASSGGWLYRLYRVPWDWLERRAMRQADHVVTNSRFTAEAIRRVFPGLQQREVPIVYPGVSVPLAPPSRSTSESLIFLVVARIDPRKGLGFALEAFVALRGLVSESIFTRCRLVIAGAYDSCLPEACVLLSDLKQTVMAHGLEDRVDFKLNADTDTLKAQWSQAFALLHPMINEHFGIVPVEAMARGLPVLAVNQGGPCETVIDGVTGALRPQEAEAFAEVMAQWAANPEQAAALGLAGWERARSTFSFERFARDMVSEITFAQKHGKARS